MPGIRRISPQRGGPHFPCTLTATRTATDLCAEDGRPHAASGLRTKPGGL